MTLGPHGFYWFSLETEAAPDLGPCQALTVGGGWQDLLDDGARQQLEVVLPSYLAGRRWFASKSRRITRTTVVTSVPVPYDGAAGLSASTARLVLVRVEFDYGLTGALPRCR